MLCKKSSSNGKKYRIEGSDGLPFWASNLANLENSRSWASQKSYVGAVWTRAATTYRVNPTLYTAKLRDSWCGSISPFIFINIIHLYIYIHTYIHTLYIYIIYIYMHIYIFIYLFICSYKSAQKTSHFHCVPKVAQNNSSPAAAKAGIRRSELRAPPTSRLCGPCQRLVQVLGGPKNTQNPWDIVG